MLWNEFFLISDIWTKNLDKDNIVPDKLPVVTASDAIDTNTDINIDIAGLATVDAGGPLTLYWPQSHYTYIDTDCVYVTHVCSCHSHHCDNVILNNSEPWTH